MEVGECFCFSESSGADIFDPLQVTTFYVGRNIKSSVTRHNYPDVPSQHNQSLEVGAEGVYFCQMSCIMYCYHLIKLGSYESYEYFHYNVGKRSDNTRTHKSHN